MSADFQYTNHCSIVTDVLWVLAQAPFRHIIYLFLTSILPARKLEPKMLSILPEFTGQFREEASFAPEPFFYITSDVAAR